MRGHIYRAKLGLPDSKPYVTVSNNARNRALESVLMVRITTTDKSRIPTAVQLGSGDPLVGYALADDIVEAWKDELEEGEYLGTLSPRSLLALNEALAQALGLP